MPEATGTKAVDNLAAGSTTEVARSADGALSVGVGAPDGATPAQVDALEGQWSVAAASEDQALANGAQGFMLAVDAPDTATGNAVVSIDATKLAETYSAQWLDRLSFTLMPSCYATTPELEECSTGIPVTTDVERTGDTVTVPLDAGDSSGSEADPGEDSATDEVAQSTDTTAQVPETLVNVTLDTAALQTVSAAPSTSTTNPAVNSGNDSTVSSAVWRGGRAADAVQQIADSSGGGLLVGSSYGAGAGGDFGASPIVSAGSWTAGGSSGAFTYSYTMAAPQIPAGPAPNVTLSYNSQTSDGRTSSTNNQVSWVGEGWDYNPGSITRTFVGCAADTANANNKDHFTGDQCWGSSNAVLSLNGTTTELVRDDTTKVWKGARGENMRVELLTEADYKEVIAKALGQQTSDITHSSNNGDNNGEFWRVTTDDGNQYFFGLNRLPGWSSGKAETNSVLNVPVAGNHDSDPCYQTKFADSFCNQGWRFQLDYVVDTTGNVMSLWWEKEKNAYARNMKEASAVSYDRGGYLSHIDYGQRVGTLFSEEPLGRMKFTAKERCFDDPALNVECSNANFDSKQSDRTRPWFDTPADLACATGKKCTTYGPTFWSRKRLASVDACTQREQGVRLTEYTSDADGNETGQRNACGVDGDSATTTLLSKVDSWGLKQSFPWNLTGEYTALWLEAISRTGYAVDGSTSRLNPVSFGHNETALPNRVRTSSSDTNPLFARLRIQDVVSEYGGRTHVDYKAPEDKCLTGASRPAIDKNHSLCYPAYWHADGELEDKRISWFHKYVVEKITEFPRLADAQDIVTTYKYETYDDAVDGALWAKSQSEFSRPKKRTWDDFRGFPTVITTTGTTDAVGGSVASKSVTRYFRGMSDDVLADDTPGTASDDVKRSVVTSDITGAELGTDRKAYAGMVAESLTYPDASADTTTGWISRTVNFPDPPVRLATRNRTDGPDVISERVTLGKTSTITKASGKGADGSSLRTVTTETEYDATYGLPTVVREHGDVADTKDNSCTRTSYVHNTSGTNHLVGLVAQTVTTTGTTTCSADLSSSTRQDTFSDTSLTEAGAISTTYAYDLRGDMVTSTDDVGNTRTWKYDALGRVTDTTDPDAGATHTEYDAFGRVLSATDPRGQTVSYTYERLNRVEQVKVTPKGSTTATVAQTYAYDGAPGGKGQLASATRYTDGKPYTTSIAGYTADYQPTAMTTALPPGSTAGLTAEGFATQYTYTYDYNDDGQLEKYTAPAAGGLSAEAVITRYNKAGLPTSVSGQDWYTSEVSYSPYGQVLRSTVGEQGHRLWQENTFNESTGELLTSRLIREAATPDTAVVPGSEVSKRSYAYDPSGNVLSVADRMGTTTDQQCFKYDTLGQLKEAWTTPGGGACVASGKTTAEPVYSDGKVNVSSNNSGYWQSYDYDVLGNRTKKTAYKADPTFTSGVRDTKGDVVTDYQYGTSDTAKNDQPHTLTSYTTTSTTKTATGSDLTVTTRSTQTYNSAGDLETRSTGGDTAQTLTWTWDGKVESVTGFGADGSGAWIGTGDMCLDLAGGLTTAGTPLQIWSCNGSKAQNFRVQAVDTNNDGTVEDATIGQLIVGGQCAQPNGTAAASPVLIQACDNVVAAQRWQTLSTGQVKHVSTGLCLSAPASTIGTDLTLAACNSTVATQGLTPAQITALADDEVHIDADMVPGDLHAEQRVIFGAMLLKAKPIQGGASRNICRRICGVLIFASGGAPFGKVKPGNGKTTHRVRSMRW
ncbi:hypothetical protein SAURM35S_01592 [Streptomyces aurantiogriseus]